MANISFFNRAYRKYSARLGAFSYILKVQQKEYPELPATEYLCNQIYECLSLEIPNYYLIRFPEDQFCFVTKNFIHGREKTQPFKAGMKRAPFSNRLTDA